MRKYKEHAALCLIHSKCSIIICYNINKLYMCIKLNDELRRGLKHKQGEDEELKL